MKLKKLEQYYDIDGLSGAIKNAISQIEADVNDDFLDDLNEIKLYAVECLSGGASGTYQSKEIIDIFGLHKEAKKYMVKDNDYYDAEVWDYVLYPFLEKLAQVTTKKIKLPKDYILFFDHSEYDSDFNMYVAKKLYGKDC